MPGANYFLSKLATQTPGPLVVSSVVKRQSPHVEPVPVGSSKPVSSEITAVASINSCQQVAPLLHKDAEVFGNFYPRSSVRQCAPNGSRGACAAPLPISIKGLEENPVGELQEVCTKMRWVFPSYAVCCENGQPHERTFVIAVRLYNIKDKGEAKSKKAAKREAARHLLIQLLERSAGQRYLTETSNVAFEYGVTANPVSKQSVSKQYQNHHAYPPHVKCIDVLQELAVKRNLRVIFIRLESISSSGIVKVMLQISTCPIVVVSGQGCTVLEAKADAAYNALECLRITSKIMPVQSLTLIP